MATMNGWRLTKELQSKGWQIVDEPEVDDPELMTFGDPTLIDPITSEVHSPYEAKRIQDQRDAGNSGDVNAALVVCILLLIANCIAGVLAGPSVVLVSIAGLLVVLIVFLLMAKVLK